MRRRTSCGAVGSSIVKAQAPGRSRRSQPHLIPCLLRRLSPHSLPQFLLALLSAHGQTLLCSGSTAYVEVSRGGFGAAHGKITQYVDAKLQAVKRVALKKEAMEMVAENGFTPDLKEAQTHR